MDICFSKIGQTLFTICWTNYGSVVHLPMGQIWEMQRNNSHRCSSSYSHNYHYFHRPAWIKGHFFSQGNRSMKNQLAAWRASRFHQRWRQLLQIIFNALHCLRCGAWVRIYSYICCCRNFCLFAKEVGPQAEAVCLWLSFVLTSRCCSSLDWGTFQCAGGSI